MLAKVTHVQFDGIDNETRGPHGPTSMRIVFCDHRNSVVADLVIGVIREVAAEGHRYAEPSTSRMLDSFALDSGDDE